MSIQLDPDKFIIMVVKIREHPDAFPIHRGFPLGNIFPMKGDESLRDEVCDQYNEYFNNKLDADDVLITTELARAIGKCIDQGYIKLGCYCSPKRCHGESIAAFLNSVLN